MIDHVDRTLSLWRQTVFGWGQSDCLLSIGDYIASRGGCDVASLFRGTYATEAEALALVTLHGGASGLIDLTGLPYIAAPRRGDVVVIDTGTKEGDKSLIAALCTGDGIAARLERGVIEINRRFATIVQAWKVD